MTKRILTKKIHENYIAPLIIGVIILILQSGKELDIINFKSLYFLPEWLFILILVFISFWLIITFWNHYIAKINNIRVSYIKSPNNLIDSKLEPKKRYGVYWQIKKKFNQADLGRNIKLQPSNVDKRIFVDIPPKCPHCNTNLEIERTSFGYYKWFCPNTDYVKRTRFNFQKRAKSAQKSIRNEIKGYLKNKYT